MILMKSNIPYFVKNVQDQMSLYGTIWENAKSKVFY